MKAINADRSCDAVWLGIAEKGFDQIQNPLNKLDF
jgi:hypothetical protein